MATIKLLKVDEMGNGTIRFQSQLLVGADTCDFIMQDGVMKNYGHGERGFEFYEYKEPYTIVENRKDMKYQEL